MQIAVLGATGKTGRLIITELFRRRHQLSILVRDSASAPDNVQFANVVIGDSRQVSTLDQLLAGADTVVSALGPDSKNFVVHRETAEALILAMKRSGITRFVGISGAGITLPGDEKSIAAKIISVGSPRAAGRYGVDKQAEYEAFAASDLDWTLVRAPRVIEGTITKQLEHDAHRSPKSIMITRGDLAYFLADVVSRGLYVREAPLVATNTRQRDRRATPRRPPK